MRLIDADEHECWACTHHATGQCDTWCDHGESFELRKDVAEAKTVDAVPVVRRKWLFDGFCGEWTCSNCKSQTALSDDRNAHPNFCPNCGLDMQKKVEE